MSKVITTVDKNVFFSTRIWWPTRIVLDSVEEPGKFEVRQLGFGDKVMCQVKSSLKSPVPTLVYYDIETYTKMWLSNVTEICSAILGMTPGDSESQAKAMLNKYTVDTYFKDAILDHFGDRLDEQDLAGIA